jgi:L-2,4-diaminobutyrate decarboxylase
MSFLTDAEIVAQALDLYYQQSISGKAPVIDQQPLEAIVDHLGLASYIRDGGLSGEALADFLPKYLAASTRLHHPKNLAHQIAAPHYAGSLGCWIDGFANTDVVIYELAPGGASLEVFLINWMLEKVGWQPAPLETRLRSPQGCYGSGVLTDGGSLANMTALLAARNRAAPEAWQEGVAPDLVVLAPAESHYSIARAAGVLGLGQRSLVRLEVDERGAVIPEKLAQALERAAEQNQRVVAVAVNACTTAVGIYDPLQEIGDICRSYHAWLHVDGAHGASALLSDKLRGRLKGIDLADSLTWDAHKMLRTPALCAALLVRDHLTLESAFQQQASYLFHEREQPGIDLAPQSFECTKAGLGLKLFLTLAVQGERALVETIESQYELAQQAYEFIQQTPGLECPVQPESNILCFRCEGSDQRQLEIRNVLIARGSAYLSSTIFKGSRYLRMALMNPITQLADIKAVIEEIQSLNVSLDKNLL